MTVKGYQGVSLIDYPGRIATVLFTGGCNFRCPFCHNPTLVLQPDTLPDIDRKTVVSLLDERAGFIDGVVVGGGEPLLDPELPALLEDVGKIGLAVKLDTNASLPDKIGKLLDDELIDAFAVDIKTSPAKYAQACGTKVDTDAVIEGIKLIRGSGKWTEFRTTCVPSLVDAGDIEAVSWMIEGAESYVLQTFDPTNTLDPSYGEVTPYTPDEMIALAGKARPQVQQVTIR